MKTTLSKKTKQVYNQAIARLKSSNFSEAVRLLTLAAHDGYPQAMFTLGNMYYWGTGIACDVDKAIFWLQRAADKGFRSAHLSLGYIYYAMVAPHKVLSGVRTCQDDYLKPQRKQLSAQQIQMLAFDNFCMAHDSLWMGIMNYEDDGWPSSNKAMRKEHAYNNFKLAFKKKSDPLSALYLWKLTKDSMWYKRGEKLLADNAHNWNNWAYTLCEWGEYAKALPYIEKALNMMKENEVQPSFLDTYAECLYGLGRKQEAERMYQKCMEAYGNNDESRMIRITWMKMKQKFYNKCA